MTVLVVLIAAGYFIGGIPVGYLLGKAWGVADIRMHGSGNIGATNVWRTAGPSAGILTLVLDIFKGALPVYLGYAAVGRFYLPLWFACFAGLAAIVGHTFTPYLDFKGGKGVATALGVFAMLMPAATGIALAVFVTVVAASRYISLGSVAASVALPLADLALGDRIQFVAFAALAAVMVIIRHIPNMKRIAAGAENKFSLIRK